MPSVLIAKTGKESEMSGDINMAVGIREICKGRTHYMLCLFVSAEIDLTCAILL